MASEKNSVLEFLLRNQWGLPENSMGVPELHDVTFNIIRSPGDNIYFRNPLSAIWVWDFSLGIFRLGIFALRGLQTLRGSDIFRSSKAFFAAYLYPECPLSNANRSLQ